MPVEITNDLKEGELWFDNSRRASLKRASVFRGDELTAAFFESGVVLIATAYRRGNEFFINFQIRIPLSFSGRTRGFLGNLDGNSTNDLFRRGSAALLSSTIPQRNLLNPLLTCKQVIILSLVYKTMRCFQGMCLVRKVFSSILESLQSLQ